jgi:hypothetical protein
MAQVKEETPLHVLVKEIYILIMALNVSFVLVIVILVILSVQQTVLLVIMVIILMVLNAKLAKMDVNTVIHLILPSVLNVMMDIL